MSEEFDREGWWAVCQLVRPDMPREQFDQDWAEFVASDWREMLADE